VISESNYEKLPGQISGRIQNFQGGGIPPPPGYMPRINTVCISKPCSEVLIKQHTEHSAPYSEIT